MRTQQIIEAIDTLRCALTDRFGDSCQMHLRIGVGRVYLETSTGQERTGSGSTHPIARLIATDGAAPVIDAAISK